MVGKHPDSLHSRFSKGFALERIKIILENDNCTFNNKFYRQSSGTAMGTIFPPTYVTLTMIHFEVHFYNICKLKWVKQFEVFTLKNWRRVLDDCPTSLDKNMVKPEELLETLNSVNEAIQLTMKFSDKKLLFLIF